MRKKSALHLEQRLETMVENAYYMVWVPQQDEVWVAEI